MQLVNEKHEESGGNCGIYLTQLIRDLNACVIEIGNDISELHKENLIEVHQGIHGVLIMKKLSKNEQSRKKIQANDAISRRSRFNDFN